MAINVKKYTKDQMAKMVEDAAEKQEAAEAEAAAHFKAGVKLAEENEKLRGEIGTLTEQIDQMNGEAINKANEIEKLKADADMLQVHLKNANDTAEAVSKELQRANSENDGLRNKLADTEAALGRANSEMAALRHDLTCEQESSVHLASVCRWLSDHPWGNLWAWAKRKLGWAE